MGIASSSRISSPLCHVEIPLGSRHWRWSKSFTSPASPYLSFDRLLPPQPMMVFIKSFANTLFDRALELCLLASSTMFYMNFLAYWRVGAS